MPGGVTGLFCGVVLWGVATKGPCSIGGKLSPGSRATCAGLVACPSTAASGAQGFRRSNMGLSGQASSPSPGFNMSDARRFPAPTSSSATRARAFRKIKKNLNHAIPRLGSGPYIYKAHAVNHMLVVMRGVSLDRGGTSMGR